MVTMTQRRRLFAAVAVSGLALVALAGPVSAKPPSGFITSQAPQLTIDPGLPSGAYVKPLISSGDELGSFLFEGIPDGIGIRPGAAKNTVDVYVAHEQSTVPFRNARDFEDSSVSKLTLETKAGARQGSVLDASVALPASAGFLRFCSANMAGPAQGLDSYVFFTGEETNDVVDGVQRGYAVVLDTENGEYTAVPGLGRLNHENTMVIPGGWDGLSMLTTDDTFDAPSSQLYMYRADDQSALFADEGELYAFRVTGRDGTPLADPASAFNGANDYLDLGVGESFQGKFIPVPRSVAIDDQNALEQWSNDNNVFQAIRLEDLTYDKNDPRTVYIADTGATRVVPDATTGRLVRGPGGTVGSADNGRVFKMVLNVDDPTVVDSLTIFADGDAVGSDVYVPFTSPDNLETSTKSLMVQEDTDDAQVFQYRFANGSWRVVATVTDAASESSGIVDASAWFGGGTWLLDVQAHGSTVAEDTVSEPGTLIKREAGQLLLMKIPGS
jgi:hypothetical protein